MTQNPSVLGIDFAKRVFHLAGMVERSCVYALQYSAAA